MAEDTQPVKRGPGRPRKNPAPKVEAPVDAWKNGESPEPPPDERIGLDVDPRASCVGYDDGRVYRVENGRIVERLDG
jgi:hypothetical protein